MKFATILGVGVVAFVLTSTASAAPILCKTVTVNHMLVDSAYVSGCLASGIGNLTGNPMNDLFINGAGAGYDSIGSGTFGQTDSAGTFSLNAALWDDSEQIAIGFKFGTGNNPDEWFVYALNDDVSSGTWEFVNKFFNPAGKPIGGGLSHIALYGKGAPPDDPPVSVPEPSSLSLLGVGLIGLALVARRRTSAA